MNRPILRANVARSADCTEAADPSVNSSFVGKTAPAGANRYRQEKIIRRRANGDTAGAKIRGELIRANRLATRVNDSDGSTLKGVFIPNEGFISDYVLHKKWIKL